MRSRLSLTSAAFCVAAILLCVTGCSGRLRPGSFPPTPAPKNSAQATARGPLPGEWMVEYDLSGGFAGVMRELIVNSSGTLVAVDRKKKIRIEKHAPPALRAEIGDLLQKADLPAASKRDATIANRCADCFHHELTAVIDGFQWKLRLDDLSLPRSSSAPLVEQLSSLLQEMLASPDNTH